MNAIKPYAVSLVNRIWLIKPIMINWMRTTPISTILTKNLNALMEFRYQEINQSRLFRESGVAQATVGRILRGESHPSTDTLEALAKALHVEPWCLLVHHFDPKDPPVLIKKSDYEIYRKIIDVAITQKTYSQ